MRKMVQLTPEIIKKMGQNIRRNGKITQERVFYAIKMMENLIQYLNTDKEFYYLEIPLTIDERFLTIYTSDDDGNILERWNIKEFIESHFDSTAQKLVEKKLVEDQ